MTNLLAIKKEIEESNDVSISGEIKVLVEGTLISIDSMGIQTSFRSGDFEGMDLGRCARIVRSTIYALAQGKQSLIPSSAINEFA